MSRMPLFIAITLLPLLLATAARSAITLTEVSTGIEGLRLADLEWVDFDVDGDLDLFTMGYPSTGDSVCKLYRNDQGTFVEVAVPFQGLGLGDADWGDFDGDGDPDVVIHGIPLSDIAATRAYRNDGGVFVDLALPLLSAHRGTSMWFDREGDGDLDLRVVSNAGHAEYVNDGSGNLAEVFFTPDGLNSGEWSRVDFDGDGRRDETFCGWVHSDDPDLDNTRVLELHRTVRPRWTRSFEAFQGISLGSVAWGDLDRDGDMDLVSQGLDDAGSQTFLRFQGPLGNFTDVLLSSYRDGDVALGDADNDGDLDLITSGINSVGARSTKVYENAGGSFSIVHDLEGLEGGEVAWGDYDGDTDLDLAIIGKADSGPFFQLYRNDTFLINNLPTTPSGLVTTGGSEEVMLSWNASSDLETGSLGLTYNVRVGSTPGGIDVRVPHAAADGTLQLARFDDASAATQYFLNPRNVTGGTIYWSVQAVDPSLGASPFSAEQSLFLPYVQITDREDFGAWRSAAADWGDYDGDGEMECALAGARVNSSGGTASSVTIIDPLEQRSISVGFAEGIPRWGDYDNDGDLDLVVTSRSDNVPAELHRNDGGDDFQLFTTTGLPTSEGGTVEWGDVDLDGDEDALFSQFGLYRNDGGLFNRLFDVPGVMAGYATFGDYDRDGDLDVLHGGDFGNEMRHLIQRNDQGSWSEIDVANSQTPAMGSFIDHDGDGDLDLVTASEGLAPEVFTNDVGVFNLDATASSGLPDITDGAILPGDMDHDGDQDLVFSGFLDDFTETVVMENVGGAYVPADANLPYRTGRGALGDVEGDGDLDLMLLGRDDGVLVGSLILRRDHSGVQRNNHDDNTAPTVPPDLSAGLGDGQIVLFWSAASDDHTSSSQLSYNLRVGTSPGANDVMSAMALPDGRRMVAREGNAGRRLFHVLDISQIQASALYWSVQAIDGSLAGSAFAPEQVAVLNPTSTAPLSRNTQIESVSPNPVGSSAQIRFRVGSPGRAALTVYDLRGRAVRKMALQEFDAGHHRVTWNGRDDAGRAVSSGTYFVRLEHGGLESTRKIVVKR